MSGQPPRRAWSARWPTGSRSPRCSNIHWVSRSRTPRSSSARRTSSARVWALRPGELHVPGGGGDQAARRAGRGPARQVAVRTRHAERVAAEASTVLRVLVEMLRDEDVQQVLDRMIVKRIAEPQWGPPIGRVLATLLDEGRQEALIQLLADRAFQWSLNAGEIIERVIERDSPTLVAALGGPPRRRPHPPRVDGLHRQGAPQPRPRAAAVGHPLPVRVRRRPAARPGRRSTRPRTSRNRSWRATRSRSAAETAWTAAKRIFLESVDDPSSALRTRIADSVVHIGESLRDDADLRDKVDNWIIRAAQHLVTQYGAEITAIITETIERWDADEASQPHRTPCGP